MNKFRNKANKHSYFEKLKLFSAPIRLNCWRLDQNLRNWTIISSIAFLYLQLICWQKLNGILKKIFNQKFFRSKKFPYCYIAWYDFVLLFQLLDFDKHLANSLIMTQISLVFAQFPRAPGWSCRPQIFGYFAKRIRYKIGFLRWMDCKNQFVKKSDRIKL